MWGGGWAQALSCGLGAGRWRPWVPQGTRGLTASPPAGSWAGVVRVAASSQKASAQPCSSSMTSRRCGSRCECAWPVGPPVSLSTWLCLLQESAHCLMPGKWVGSSPERSGREAGGAPGQCLVWVSSLGRGACSGSASCFPYLLGSLESGTSLGLSVLSCKMGLLLLTSCGADYLLLPAPRLSFSLAAARHTVSASLSVTRPRTCSLLSRAPHTLGTRQRVSCRR